MIYRNITRYKYQLAQPMTFSTGIGGFSFKTTYFTMFPDGMFVIKEGYLWDGPSGPTIDSMDSMRASLIHDALYEAIRRELLPLTVKDQADRIFHKVLIEDGMDTHKAHLWFDIVSRFGWSSCVPGDEVKDNICSTEAI